MASGLIVPGGPGAHAIALKRYMVAFRIATPVPTVCDECAGDLECHSCGKEAPGDRTCGVYRNAVITATHFGQEEYEAVRHQLATEFKVDGLGVCVLNVVELS